ncbi:MAG TPA: tetratricopeptide repeat protein [Planctomycetota bacterium]|nr:tetratricopeptide repeat protein [Planctomycetota bacterium]
MKKNTASLVGYGILGVLALVFGVKTFLFGGGSFEDPNDSPLYKSTLDRAIDNFKDSSFDARDGKPAPVGTGTQGRHAANAAGGAAKADPAQQYLISGSQLYQQGKYAEAAAQFEYAARISPNVGIYQYLYAAYDKAGDKAKAKQAYEKVLQFSSASAGSTPAGSVKTAGQNAQPPAGAPAKQHVELGVQLYHQRKYAEAIKQFEEAVKLDPKDTNAYSWIGYSYFALHDYGKMIGTYEAALRHNPDDAELHYNKGLVLKLANKTGEARASYSKALELDPTHTRAHAGLGQIFQAEGKTEEAMKEFQYEIDYCNEQMKLKPEDSATYYRLASFYLQNNINIAEGRGLIAKAIQLKPENVQYLVAASQLEMRSGNRQKAIELIDMALAKEPESQYLKQLKKNLLSPPAPVKPVKEESDSKPADEEAQPED